MIWHGKVLIFLGFGAPDACVLHPKQFPSSGTFSPMIIKKSKILFFRNRKFSLVFFENVRIFSRLCAPGDVRLTVGFSIENEQGSAQSLSCYWCHKTKKYTGEFSISNKQNFECLYYVPGYSPGLGNGPNNVLSHLNQSRDSFSSFEIMFFLEKSMNSIESH